MATWLAEAYDQMIAAATKPAVGTQLTAEQCMHLALCQGLLGAGQVSPNPMVGAVAVDSQHRFLGWGGHLQCGSSHAEVNLIESLREGALLDRVRGGTIYVSLEPCAHVGKTPACAPQLADLGLRQLVFGQVDPNPLVNGAGIRMLQASGVECQQNDFFAEKTGILTRSFSWSVKNSVPLVGLKVAASLDGVSGLDGSRRFWITGQSARDYGHWLRLLYDGVLVSAGTVQADDPRLDCRHPRISGRSPKRLVLDLDGRLMKGADFTRHALFAHDPTGVYWLVTKSACAKAQVEIEALRILGGHCLELETQVYSQELVAEILEKAHNQGIQSLLIEGGAKVWSLFLNARSLQRLHLFQNARIFGQQGTRSWHEGVGLANPVELGRADIFPVGDDWVVEADLV